MNDFVCKRTSNISQHICLSFRQFKHDTNETRFRYHHYHQNVLVYIFMIHYFTIRLYSSSCFLTHITSLRIKLVSDDRTHRANTEPTEIFFWLLSHSVVSRDAQKVYYSVCLQSVYALSGVSVIRTEAYHLKMTSELCGHQSFWFCSVAVLS